MSGLDILLIIVQTIGLLLVIVVINFLLFLGPVFILSDDIKFYKFIDQQIHNYENEYDLICLLYMVTFLLIGVFYYPSYIIRYILQQRKQRKQELDRSRQQLIAHIQLKQSLEKSPYAPENSTYYDDTAKPHINNAWSDYSNWYKKTVLKQ